MKIDLSKMQKKVDNVMNVFNNIVKELSTQIGELNKGIESNNQTINNATVENILYAEKIKEYETLKNKVEAIIK